MYARLCGVGILSLSRSTSLPSLLRNLSSFSVLAKIKYKLRKTWYFFLNVILKGIENDILSDPPFKVGNIQCTSTTLNNFKHFCRYIRISPLSLFGQKSKGYFCESDMPLNK